MEKYLSILILYFYSHVVIANSYIGNTVPPYPPNHISQGGNLVAYKYKSKEILYAIARTEKETSQYFWLNKEVGRKNNNKSPIWQVRDVIILPKPEKGYFYASGVCRLNDKDDDRIIALVKYEERYQWFTTVLRAWVANTESEKIETIESKGISCQNEGWGL